MSDELTKWLNDNYPISAKEMANSSDRQCVQHALKKWKGALKAKAYNLTYDDHAISLGARGFLFDSDSCSLCKKYPSDCRSRESRIPCPIVRYRGEPCEGYPNIYLRSCDDPKPMINLLKETLNFIKQERAVIVGNKNRPK